MFKELPEGETHYDPEEEEKARLENIDNKTEILYNQDA